MLMESFRINKIVQNDVPYVFLFTFCFKAGLKYAWPLVGVLKLSYICIKVRCSQITNDFEIELY